MLLPSEAEQQLQAMEAAWGGTADARTDAAEGQEGSQLSQQQQAQQPAATLAGPAGPAGRPRAELTNTSAEVQGHGAVDMAEAVETVEAHRGSGSSGSNTSSLSASAAAVAKAAAAAVGGQKAGSGTDGGDGKDGNSNGSKRRLPPVAVDAERASFERLLLMPDMLSDHLPDRYVSALQQL